MAKTKIDNTVKNRKSIQEHQRYCNVIWNELKIAQELVNPLNRDILLYWLWQEGKYTNLQIGELFGLTHSSVSRRVTIIRKKITLEQNFQSQIESIKSQIKP